MEARIDQIQLFVKQIREKYFFDYTINKDEKITKQTNHIAEQLDTMIKQEEQNKKLSKSQRAKLFSVRAILLDCFSQYQKLSQDYLNKSIKLSPSNHQVWNALGHVLWKKKDFQKALQAYENAITQGGKNKVSLRQQSVVLRSIGSKAQRMKNVSDSVQLAKQALLLDMQDGVSWLLVGNAYLHNFFVNMKQIQQLHNSLKAYKKAQAILKYKNADLYYNRGQVNSYLQNYNQALNDFQAAAALDAGLDANKIIQKIRLKLRNVTNIIDNNKNVKPKQMMARVDQIPSAIKKQPSQGNYKIAYLCDLIPGKNIGAALIASIIRPCNNQQDIPSSFVFLSKCGKFGTISIYNCSGDIFNHLSKGAIVNVFDPFVKHIKVDSQAADYYSISVFQPQKMLVDNQSISNLFTPYQITNISI